MIELISSKVNIDFVGKRHLWVGISVVALLASFVLLFTKGLNYGIDFTGGAEIQVRVPPTWDIGKLRTVLLDGGLKDVRLQAVGGAGSNTGEFLIRTPALEGELKGIGQKIEEIFGKQLSSGEFIVEKVDVVGPAAGSLLKIRGFQSMFFALLVILVYVTVRFDARYAPGAVLALFHDSMICIGIYCLTGRQFDLSILAAILALIGYSNNDTIIVYDRVRETSHLQPSWSIEKIVNQSVNETLGRTIMTSLATFLVVLCLWVLGGPVLENFAFAFLVGIAVGSYSSIFVASSIVIYLTNFTKRRAAMARSGEKKKTFTVRPNPSL